MGLGVHRGDGVEGVVEAVGGPAVDGMNWTIPELFGPIPVQS
jgi:hypothetical protein